MLSRMKMSFMYFIWRIESKLLFKKNRSNISAPIRIKNPQYFEVGKNCKIDRQARIECLDSFAGERLFPKFVLEDGVIIGLRAVFWISDELSIGRDTIIANDVLITTENHGIDPEKSIPYHAQPLMNRPVSIGKNCWIGAHTIILPGVVIGDNCVVGAGSVVTKSFPSNTIIVGNPARCVKKYDFFLHEWVRS